MAIMAESRLLAGAMSGTSADGVDVAICNITGWGLEMRGELVGHHHVPYDEDLRRAILTMRNQGEATFGALARVGRRVSLAYVTCIRAACAKAGLQPQALHAAAVHGQTLFHAPPDTLQWIDPALIACELGCTVVSDFRRADCAAGGQGAPLVPFADYLLFRHPHKHRVLLNIGGIANVTLLPGGGGFDDLCAFDTGPGNCISDDLMHDQEGVDIGGAGALRGKPDMRVVATAEQADYFRQPPPKSTDGPAMLAIFREAAATAGMLSREDQLATAAELVARTIAGAIHKTSPWGDAPFELIASGGGVHNQAIMTRLAQHLPRATITPIESFGIVNAAKEAMAFALLGAATLDGQPSNVPAATGAKRRVILGSVTRT